MNSKYIAAEYGSEAFHCPHCGVFSHHSWGSVARHDNIINHIYLKMDLMDPSLFNISICNHCSKFSLWVNEKLIFPQMSPIESPNSDMPDEIMKDYLEARAIFNLSKRGSLALLRLALQKLLKELGGEGKSINQDIAYLVREKGLNAKIQKAMDSLRVFGDQGVHPLEMDMTNDIEITPKMFTFMNLIVDAMITQPRLIDEIYEKIPENKKNGIENRDSLNIK